MSFNIKSRTAYRMSIILGQIGHADGVGETSPVRPQRRLLLLLLLLRRRPKNATSIGLLERRLRLRLAHVLLAVHLAHVVFYRNWNTCGATSTITLAAFQKLHYFALSVELDGGVLLRVQLWIWSRTAAHEAPQTVHLLRQGEFLLGQRRSDLVCPVTPTLIHHQQSQITCANFTVTHKMRH